MTASAQTKKLKLKLQPRFWLDEIKDAKGNFINRYQVRHALEEVTVKITRDAKPVFEEKLNPPNGVNQIALDKFLAQLKAAKSAPAKLVVDVTLTPGTNQLSSGPAGPDLGPPPAAPTGQQFETRYRPLRLRLTFDAELAVTAATVLRDRGKRGPHGMVQLLEEKDTQVVDVDWRFDWLRRNLPIRRPKVQSRGTSKVEALVLHQTGNDSKAPHLPFAPISSTLDSFNALPPKPKKDKAGKLIPQTDRTGLGTHYVVDVDGHVVKTGDEKEFMNHGGHSCWKEFEGVSSHSLGIEQVHNVAQKGEFPKAQLDANLDLVTQIVKKHKIRPDNIVGHADIRCISKADADRNKNNKTRAAFGGFVLNPSDRTRCPGVKYPWNLYEDSGVALKPKDNKDGKITNYAVFVKDPKRRLRFNDAKKLPEIEEIQTDLETIGWPFSDSHPRDRFDRITETVVQRFQARFLTHFAAASKKTPDGIVDAETGLLIKRVLAALPPVPKPPSTPPPSKPPSTPPPSKPPSTPPPSKPPSKPPPPPKK